ncbi:Nup133 N terminal like-domain-containing protein [Myxozyma melibiosi]|uniref:Nup133 N terminal like-domain-containing protein n=1 Tax=Myxozyma melibiosi TaxID=54550 RepID=A0ABR1FD73_9ASCO
MSSALSQRRSARLQARRSRQVSGLIRQPSEAVADSSQTAVSLASKANADVPLSTAAEQKAKDSVIEYTKNSKYCVLKLPALPNILKTSEDFTLHGYLDSATDFALLISPASAYVWRYISPDRLPATISFPISNATGTLPLGVLVSPSAGSDEPGLVLVNPLSGQITYWEAVGGVVAEGLLHRKKGVEALISLYQGETLEYLQNIEPAGVIVATSSGRFVLVALHDAAGRPGITCTGMRGSGTGLWSNLKGVLKFGSTRRDLVAIKPGKIIGRGERMVVTANVRGAVTLWQCSRSAHYELMFEMELKDQLLQSIDGVYPRAEQTFQVHDIEMLPDDESTGLILASFIYNEDSGLEQVYYILFTVSLVTNDFRIISAHRITCYTSPSSQRPRLLLPKPGYTAFIVLSHAVVMVDTVLQQQRTRTRTTTLFKWEDVIEFKKDTIDVIFSGTEDIVHENNQITRHAGIILVARRAGVIRIERFEDESSYTVVASSVDVIKSKLEQAVYYGFKEENPVDFGRGREVGYEVGDVEQALTEVSDEIISSSSVYSTEYPDTTECLSLRTEALGRLAEHLQYVFPSLSTECRIKTLTKLEKSEAARNVWVAWTSMPGRTRMLSEVITDLSKQENYDEQWFRVESMKIGDLAVAFSTKSLVRAQTASGHRGQMLKHVIESNEMLLTVLAKSAYRVREAFEQQLFHLEQYPPSTTEPWTSTWEILTALGKQYDVSRALASQLWELSEDQLSEFSGELKQLLDQLVALVKCLCESYEERIAYCSSLPDSRDQYEKLTALYLEQRGTWIKPLMGFGYNAQAYSIAETYRDFRTLAEMCREEKSELEKLGKETADRQELLALRLNRYFETYGYDFASVVYQYYIDTGHISELFVAFPGYKTYLERFLSSGEYDRMAWIHDIQQADFESAGDKLLKVSNDREEPLANRVVQASIAKLCAIQTQISGGEVREKLQEIEDTLEEIKEKQVEEDEKYEQGGEAMEE